jgi:hypothetical protein
LLLRMGAGLAAAGRPLGATVEVRLQQHGARRVEEQCQNDTVHILYYYYYYYYYYYIFFFICGDPKMGYNMGFIPKLTLFRFSPI